MKPGDLWLDAPFASAGKSRLARLAQRFSLFAGLLAIVIGGSTLAGYFLDIAALRNFLEPGVPIKANTALCFALIGMAQMLSHWRRRTPAPAEPGAARRVASIIALLAALIGLLTLAEVLFGVNLGIDEMLASASADALGDGYATRMSPESAICFVLLALTVPLSHSHHANRTSVMTGALFSLLVLVLASSSLSTYLSDAPGVFGWLGAYVMAGKTVFLFALLGAAAFMTACAHPAFMWELGKSTSAGFALGLVLLIMIGLFATRAQHQISATNIQLAKSESLYARSADTFSSITQHYNHVLGYLLTDDLRYLDASLTAADRARQLLSRVNADRAADPTETWLYAPFDARVQDILTWSALTIAAGRSGLSGENRELMVRRGNELLARLSVGFEQLESEHRYYVAELKRQSDYVGETSFMITTLGMVASLALFAFVLLRVNHLVGERDRARLVLSESEQQYRTLADSGQAMIWTAGTDAMCNYFNKVWLEFTGRTLEQEYGNGWAAGVHPDDLQQCLDIYLQAFAKREKFSMDYRLRRHDGSYRWIQDDGSPRYDSEGRFLGYIGYCLDSTERKLASEALRESELRFRTLLDGISSVAVQGYGADLVTNYWNPASAELYGYSAEEALGRKLTELIIPPAMVAEVERAVAGMLSSGQPIPTGELTLMRKGGGPVNVISSHAVVNVPGKTPVLFCVDVDIGQRKRAESELQRYRDHLEELVASRTAELAEAKDAAEAANRAKSTFLANMSHEIRTPMNAIIGFAHLLKKDLPSGEAQIKLSRINEAAQHLLGLINNILDLSKIEAGQISAEEHEFSPAEIVHSTVSLLHERATSKGLTLGCSIDQRVPPVVLGDAMRLSQILLNFVGNAIKFSEHGEIAVHLYPTDEDAESIEFRCEVSDQGIGLSAEQQQQIFHAFVQADGSTTRKYGGTGLGLVISRQLARILGGEVGVVSQPGVGSTFWLRVCFRKCSALQPPPPSGEPATLARGPLEDVIRERFGGLRVLLAEDDVISREIALELLHIAGLQVDSVDNGSDAVARASTADYALIILDMQMPGINGLAAARAIRALPGRAAYPPIVAMTANAFDEDRQACLEAGMNDHVCKPVDPDALYATLLRWFESTTSARGHLS